MFGRPLSEYLRFQKPILVALVVVGALRLALSLAGLPDTTVRWLPMNVVAWMGTIYYGVAVHTRGFGGYRQVLGLVFIQMVVFQLVAVVGILFAIAGQQNIFAAPEYSIPGQSQWMHLLAHLTIGVVAATLISWAIGSLVLFVTRKVVRQPALAA